MGECAGYVWSAFSEISEVEGLGIWEMSRSRGPPQKPNIECVTLDIGGGGSTAGGGAGDTWGEVAEVVVGVRRGELEIGRRREFSPRNRISSTMHSISVGRGSKLRMKCRGHLGG